MSLGFSLTLGSSLFLPGGPDVIAPGLWDASATPLSQTAGDFTVTTNEGRGTLYWYASQSGTPPSAANLMNGTGSIFYGNQEVTVAGPQIGIAGNLDAGETYYVHFIQTDLALNESNIVSSNSFTTLPPPVPETDPSLLVVLLEDF